MNIPHNSTPELMALARQMRQSPTSAEKELWQHLRARRLQGSKFRRQHILLGYIVDFYCPECRLVIELDGGGHDAARDAKRDALCAAWDVLVLRFPNEKPMEEILLAVKAAIRGQQLRFISQMARSAEDLKAVEHSADWYAERKLLLDKQAAQMELQMASSEKKKMKLVRTSSQRKQLV